MTETLKRLSEYPDISFIDGISFEELKEEMIRNYQQKYKELTGKDVVLAPADPYRLILYSCAMAVYQGYQYEDRAGKMGLLKYSTGNYLDNLAAFKGVHRNFASPARTTVRFTLSSVLNKDAVIPAGTRMKGLDLYFETTQEGRITAGESYTELSAECQTAGTVGNGYLEGYIDTLVDPLPYTLKVQNITATSGGTDIETDEELAERIYLAPSGYSTAGPARAYEFWVKTYSQSIDECIVTSESPGEVDIYITVDGNIPTDSFMNGLSEYINSHEKRPLTDYVVIKKPDAVEYEIECIYYIRNSDRGMEDNMKQAAEKACDNYILWQKRIGRDVTPSQLIYELIKAGIQSVEIKKPLYTEIKKSQVAITKAPVMVYGGIRDD